MASDPSVGQSGGRPWIVGSVRAQPMPITVRREPEVGQAWEAEIVDLGRAALGATPREAVESLVSHLDWLEIEALDDAVLDRIERLPARLDKAAEEWNRG